MVNYSQLSACQGDMEPFEGSPSTCGCLTSLRNKPQQKQPRQLSASIVAWIVSQCIQLSFDGEKCVLLLCAWKASFLKSGHIRFLRLSGNYKTCHKTLINLYLLKIEPTTSILMLDVLKYYESHIVIKGRWEVGWGRLELVLDGHFSILKCYCLFESMLVYFTQWPVSLQRL